MNNDEMNNNGIQGQGVNDNSFSNQEPLNNTNLVQGSQNPIFTQNSNGVNEQGVMNYDVSGVSGNINGSQTANQSPQMNSQNMQTSVVYKNRDINQQSINVTSSTNDDEELLKAFIGKNYDKITTKSFNFSGFFFSRYYMLYRKMFLYEVLLFLVFLLVSLFNIKFGMDSSWMIDLTTINLLITFLFHFVLGFFVNKIYLYYAKKKIQKIKLSNSGKNIDEIKSICASKGGTSVSQLLLGELAGWLITVVVMVIMVIVGIGDFIVDYIDTVVKSYEYLYFSEEKILVEDVTIDGYSCFGSNCSISIGGIDYILSVDNIDIFTVLGDYGDYVKLNIYYVQDGDDEYITNYKLFIRSTDENISNVTTESELRDKIGLYSEGTYTESFTLTKIGTTGFGYEDDTAYTYIDYTFVDGEDVEYEMTYINSDGSLDLVEGNMYTVTFEVVDGTFGYEFNIKTIE